MTPDSGKPLCICASIFIIFIDQLFSSVNVFSHSIEFIVSHMYRSVVMDFCSSHSHVSSGFDLFLAATQCSDDDHHLMV